MNDDELKSALHELDAVLEEERAKILNGEIDGLEQTADRKRELVAQINAGRRLPLAELHEMNSKLRRNHGLIESALEGIRSVLSRIEEVKRIRAGLSVYDGQGNIQTIRFRGARKVETRA